MPAPPDRTSQIRGLYASFNARDWSAVTAHLAADVQWANGMDGGYVFGIEDVLDYWSRQFQILSSAVTPIAIETPDASTAMVQVHQLVRRAADRAVVADGQVWHRFTFDGDGAVVRFDIVDPRDA